MKQNLFELGKNSILYGAGMVLQRMVTLLLLPLLTAYLSPAEFGVFAMLMLLSLVAQSVFGLGMSAAMGPAYFRGKDEGEKSQVVWTTFSLLVISSMILLACAWSIPGVFLELVYLPKSHELLATLVLTATACLILSSCLAQRVQFEKQAVRFVTIALITSLVTAAVSIVSVVCFGWGVKGLIAAQLIGNAVALTLYLALTVRETQFSLNLDVGREILKIGIPLIPSFAFLFILMNAGRYFLQTLEGPDQVGIYTIGHNLGAMIGLVVGAISTAWYPFFMSFIDRQEEARILFARIFSYYVLGVGTLCLLFFALAKPAVILLTQPAFYSAYLVVGLAALSHFFIGIFNLSLPALYFSNRVTVVSVVQGASVVISIPLIYVLTSSFGLIGAAISGAIAHLVMASCLLLLNFGKRELFFSVRHDWKRIIRFSLGAMLIILISLNAETASITGAWLLALALSTACLALVISCLSRDEICTALGRNPKGKCN